MFGCLRKKEDMNYFEQKTLLITNAQIKEKI